MKKIIILLFGNYTSWGLIPGIRKDIKARLKIFFIGLQKEK
jgi:hypothetical protein